MIVTAVASFMDNFTKVMPILAKMKAEGRTTFSTTEWATVNDALDKSEAAAVTAVATL